jgi:hypothetical protein
VHNHFTSTRQRDARLAASKHQFLFCGDYKPMTVDIHFNMPRLPWKRSGIGIVNATHDERTRRIPIFEHEHDVASDVRSVQIEDRARREGGRTRLSLKHYKGHGAIILERNKPADERPIDPRTCALSNRPIEQVFQLTAVRIQEG